MGNLLDDHRTDVNLGDSRGWALLRFAIRWGYKGIIRLIPGNERVEVNVHGLGNEMLLYVTVNVENEAVVVGLLLEDHGMEVGPWGKDDRTPLNLSGCCRYTGAVRALLKDHRVELIPVMGTVGRR